MTSPYFSSLSWEMRRRILDELEKELTMPKGSIWLMIENN